MSSKISPRELLHERAQRKMMVTPANAEHADGEDDPMWYSKAFYGEFGDAFLQDTTLEGGHTSQSIPDLINIANEVVATYADKAPLSLFKEKTDLAKFQRVLDKLSLAAQNDTPHCGPSAPIFVEYLKRRSQEVQDLAVGDFLLWCGGWSKPGGGHAIMYLVDRTSDTEISFVVLNTGEGVGHHPGVGSDKTKRHTAMRHNNIPIENCTNTSWLYFLFRNKTWSHKDHGDEIFYDIILPALLQTTLVASIKKSGEDQWMIPETLQRSGTCYYRCIMTAMRYSMRRLGLEQNQVKQMLHVIRRGYVGHVIEDLKKSHEMVNNSNPSDPSLRGLYPSQVSLVRLAASQLGYSAVKESQAGRMTEEVLGNIVQEVEQIEQLVSTLPVFGGPLEYQNEWMAETLQALTETKENETLTGNFSLPSILSQTTLSDLSSFQGPAVVENVLPPLDFSLLPHTKDDVTDVKILLSTFLLTKKLVVKMDSNKLNRSGTRRLEIATLVERVLLELIPFPIFVKGETGDEEMDARGGESKGESKGEEEQTMLGCWEIDSAESYYDLLDVLNDLSVYYSAACESMKYNESQSTRILTHSALSCMFYHVLRIGPKKDQPTRAPLKDDEWQQVPLLSMLKKTVKEQQQEQRFDKKELLQRIQVDLVFSNTIRGGNKTKLGLPEQGFSIDSPAEESFFEICTCLVFDRPILLRARSDICTFMTAMQAKTQGMFTHLNSASGQKFEIREDDANLKFVKKIRQEANKHLDGTQMHRLYGVKELKESPPNAGDMKSKNQGRDPLCEFQEEVGWYILPLSYAENPSNQSYLMKSILMARDYFTRYKFNLRKLTYSGAQSMVPLDNLIVSSYKVKFDDKLDKVEISFNLGSFGMKKWMKSQLKYDIPLSDPHNYVIKAATSFVNEDDILHNQKLKDFNGNLSQEEAEQLYTYLTTPYLRIPLVLNFFSRERVGCLFNVSLQHMLEHTLFVPGNWGSIANDETLKTIPCKPEELTTKHGYLVAELERGPSITLRSFTLLLQDGKKLAVGDYRSSFVIVLLFLFRLNIKMIQFIVDVQKSGESSEEKVLVEYDGILRQWLDEALVLIRQWLVEAEEEAAHAFSCMFHAHIAMTVWTGSDEMDTENCARLISSCSFLRTWHVCQSGSGMDGFQTEEEKQKKKKEEKEEEKGGAEDDAAKSENLSQHMGLAEQEMFWLIESKRNATLSYISNTSVDEVKDVLLRTVIAATSDTKSYSSWNATNPKEEKNIIKNQAGDIITFMDDAGMFKIDVQKCCLSLQQSSFAPVSSEIARTSDFRHYFKNKIPHCAELLKSTYLNSVLIVSGNLLIESWATLPNGQETDILGAPNDGLDLPELLYYETEHPYTSNMKGKMQKFTVKDATSLIITFDERCVSEARYDYLCIIGGDLKLKFDGKNFPDTPVIIPGNTVSMGFVSDASGNQWGVKLSIKGKKESKAGTKYTFGNEKFGGGDRVWKYDESPPSDLMWMPEILDPVFHKTMTVPPKGRGKYKWIEVTVGKSEKKVKLKATKFLLPVKKVDDAAIEVTMLMLMPGFKEWKFVRVNRLYHFVEVYTMDVFGRRGYPKLSYTSDYRMSIGTMEVNKEQSLHPHSSMTRFSSGDVFTPLIGGKDVVITDQNEGEDMRGPRMYLPQRVTNGMLPGALSEVFDMYELKKSNGDWIGKQKSMMRQTEKGTMVPFVDAFYDYDLEVRGVREGTTNAIVRRDVDPVTQGESGRRLVSLTSSNETSSREIVRLLTQIESISHILAWSKPLENYEDAFNNENLLPDIIDLPRLRVKFSVSRLDDGSIRLYVVDSGGKYVLTQQSNVVNPTLTRGIPSHLLLTTSSGSIHIMVPNCPMVRPKVSFCPFTTCTVNDMDNIDWQYSCNARYYLYEVHPSDTFVLFTSIGATLYWAFLKFLHREYVDAFAAIISCGTDMPLTWSEQTMLSYFNECKDDHHPHAHACRLKLRLALQHSPIDEWPIIEDKKGKKSPLCDEYEAYLTKRTHVALGMRLSLAEEIILMNYMAEHYLGGTASATRMTRKHLIETSHPELWVPVKKHMKDPSGHRLEPFKYDFGGTCDGCQNSVASGVYMKHCEPCNWGLCSDCESHIKEKPKKPTKSDRHNTWFNTMRNGGIDYTKQSKALATGNNGKTQVEKIKSNFFENIVPNKSMKYTGTLVGTEALQLLDSTWDTKSGDMLFIIQAMMSGELSVNISEPKGAAGNTLEQRVANAKKAAQEADENDADDAEDLFDEYQALKMELKEQKKSGGGSKNSSQDLEQRAADATNEKVTTTQYLAHMLARRLFSVGGGNSEGNMVLQLTTLDWKKQSLLNGQLKSLDELPSDTQVCYITQNDTENELKNDSHKWRQEWLLPHCDIIAGQSLDALSTRLGPIDKFGPTKIRQERSVGHLTSSVDASDHIPGTTDYARPMTTLKVVENMGPASVNSEDIAAFMKQPISQFVNFDEYVTFQPMSHEALCPDKPPYDLSGHADAETVVAQQARERINVDCAVYAAGENSKKATVCVGITPELLKEYAEQQEIQGIGNVAPSFGVSALERLSSLKNNLLEALEKDTKRMREGTKWLIEHANQVPNEQTREILEYRLQKNAGLRATMSLTHLVACIVSSKSGHDVQSFNPYVEAGGQVKINHLLVGTAGVIMVSLRISQIRRALGGIADVEKAIQQKIDSKNMIKEIDGLIGNLLAERHYTKNDSDYDPRFLMFEFLTCFLLRKSQVYLTEVFMKRAVDGGNNEWGDEIQSMVHQMIMGAGKTTVIGPIMALMLADSKSLVTQVVPTALLDMSRNVMWKQYCQVIVKPVYTLTFSRSWPTEPDVYEKMHTKMLQARSSGGIVVTTPSAIKSIVNKYIELLNIVSEVEDRHLLIGDPDEELAEDRNPSPAKRRKIQRKRSIQMASETADAIARVMNLWSERERGILLLDEVDMLLHPLRSELNFPIGEKFPLQPSPTRWDLPMHLLDTILQASYVALDDNADDSSSGDGKDTVDKELVEALKQGLHEKSLQRTPHLVLLDHEFYSKQIKMIIAKRSLTWMKAHHLFEGMDAPSQEQMLEYVTKGNASSPSCQLAVGKLGGQKSDKNKDAGKQAIQALNLAYDWVGSFIPHTLSKICRVNFGLLQPADEEVLSGQQPASRKLLGIPFVGKDVPSPAAEFAQPDVLIGKLFCCFVVLLFCCFVVLLFFCFFVFYVFYVFYRENDL